MKLLVKQLAAETYPPGSRRLARMRTGTSALPGTITTVPQGGK